MTEPTPPRADAVGGDDAASPFTIEDTGSTINAADLTEETPEGPTDRRSLSWTAVDEAPELGADQPDGSA